jgi:catecholate siderophore receptor
LRTDLAADGNAAEGNDEWLEIKSTGKVSIACLVAVGSITGAEAQQAPLPPVTIDAPVTRPRPPAAKPTAEQLKVRAALRRQAQQAKQAAQAASTPAPNAAGAPAPDRDPYADPGAPYKADRLSSQKFSEPIANTPRTITVLTKDVIADKNATSLKEVTRTTAGVTLGTGEGGNAFGDRFFIRGFDARNDIFVDGVRDPAVSIRENFFTEQIEILRGPASTISGRGTTGGALNIVTKQAGDTNFYNSEGTLGTDGTRRVTFDVNQVISPTLSVRLDGMAQDAGVAGRQYIYDDRWGSLAAVKWTPTNDIKITANYIHTDLSALPDFGVPYDKPALVPFTDAGVPRNTFYGFVNRDFQKTQQDIGTLNGSYEVNEFLKLNNKIRDERSVLNYIGTLPETPNMAAPNPANWTVTLNPQSRYQVTNVIADLSDATFKFDTGPIRHTAVLGTEFSREHVTIDSYTGLASEAIGAGAFTGSGSLVAPLFVPPNLLPFTGTPTVTGNPTVIPVDTKAVYLLETANFRDFIIVNGGVRYDDYDVSAYKAATPGTVISDQSGLVNYNGGIVVKPLPFASLYAAYATGAEPVGAELDGSSANYGGLNPTATVNQIFGPELSRAVEVGTKWELFNRHLLATGALFRTNVTNAREAIPTGLPNAGTIVAGAAYQVQGIDLEVQGKITDKWSVYGGLVLMQSVVTQSVVATDVGDRLANVANQSFNLLSKYQVTDKVEVGGQATYRSQIYGGTLLAANQGTVLPGYWRFDAFAEYKINKNFTAKLFVNNIFDKTYYDAFYQSAAPFVLIAPGRSASLVLQAKF